MAVHTIRWDHQKTSRLVLDHTQMADIDELHEIHADPRVWTHLPSGRHTSLDQTAELVQTIVDGWSEAGLSYWSVREEPAGRIIGCGGCRPVAAHNRWNLYYRFLPEVHGLGYATELSLAAMKAAHDVDSNRAVVAIMLEGNPASQRVAEKCGMTRIWSGADEGNPDPTAIRLVYSDRPETQS